MTIIKDKEPIFDTDKYEVILVGTNIHNILRNGFQGKLANKYPYIVDENNKQPYADTRRLGTRITIERKGFPTISLMYICGVPQRKLKTIDYNALKQCLETAALEFKGKRVMTTVLGSTCFDGGGDKRRVLRIMEKAFGGIDIDVYDYAQKNLKEEASEKRELLIEMGISDGAKRAAILRQLYLLPPLNGKK